MKNKASLKSDITTRIIFDEHLPSGSRSILAEAIIGSDYSGKGVVQQAVLRTGITGGPVLNTGVTGSGITGYESISSGEIELENKKLQEALVEITKKKISVDNPKYSTYKKLVE